MTDPASLPESPSPETLRAVVVYMQRDIRQLQRDLEKNETLDDEDRRLLARLDDRTQQLLTRMDKSPLVQIGDFFSRLFGLGDNARRPWVWVVLLAVLVLSAAAYFGKDTYYGDEARGERLEALRRQDRADSLAAARAYQLEMMRLRREIADDQADEAEARSQTPDAARIDELDVEAENLNVQPPRP